MTVIKAYTSAVTKAYASTVIPGFNSISVRGNTVGKISVIPDVYDTNSGSTTITVGASGADYTTLAAAWTAASAGNVIEIIDDSISLAAVFYINKGKDGNGKAIKIKGKSTKSTIELFANAYPLQTNGNGRCVEFENIIFTEPTNTALSVFFNGTDNLTGFCHFINCDFNTVGNVYVYNSLESVFDRCSFLAKGIANAFNSSVGANAKLIINECTTGGGYLLTVTAATPTTKFGLISVTNCTAVTDAACVGASGVVSKFVTSWRIEGNSFHAKTYSAFTIGYEASWANIDGITNWDNSTNYVVGDVSAYRCILYECLVNNSNSQPDKDVNTNWRRARFTTGTLKNNTIFKTGTGAGHGVFLGYGTYNFIVENNIISGHDYSIVIKGHDHYIRQNCICNGTVAGLSIFSNDQLEVRNNTIRSSLLYGPQSINNTTDGPVITDFKNNIFYSSSVGFINDNYSRWGATPPVIANTFLNNKFYNAASVDITFEGVAYTLPDELNELKTAMGDNKAEHIDPQFVGEDATVESFYKPTNPLFLAIKDELNQAVGAVDYFK